MNTPPLRDWQHKALSAIDESWLANPSSNVLVAACPGTGKTLMACVAALNRLKAYACGESNGVTLILVVAPTINVKQQWCDSFRKLGVHAFDGASNEAMRFRRDRNERIVGDFQAICITYSQLAKDVGLFCELLRREKVLLIADEVHHADDCEVFGRSLSDVAELSTLRLALSGTPFNTSGGALAMCPFEVVMNDEGNPVRKAKPLYTYSYGDAVKHSACRPVEFVKMYGIGKSTYRSLSTKENFQKIVDLVKENKTDSLASLLDADGDFLREMLREGLVSLQKFKVKDKMAGMLVVAKSKEHGSRIVKLIDELRNSNPDWRTYSTLEVYNDTDKAHERIANLRHDRTDIVVTVRMISEGVDIQRLRVGVYATDYLTPMFFIQFVGRVLRWESRLDSNQYGCVIIPAHINLLIYARAIERMCDEAMIEGGDEDGPGGEKQQKNELIGVESEHTTDGVIFRGRESDERDLAAALFQKCKSIIGVLSEHQAIILAKELNLDGASHEEDRSHETNWRSLNSKLVGTVARLIKLNGDNDDRVYSKVNATANRHAGIPRVDDLTPIDALKKRHAFLKSWASSLLSGKEFVNESVG